MAYSLLWLWKRSLCSDILLSFKEIHFSLPTGPLIAGIIFYNCGQVSCPTFHAFQIPLQLCDYPFQSSVSIFTTSSLSKVGQGPLLCAMADQVVSSLPFGHIMKCNQASVRHSCKRIGITFIFVNAMTKWRLGILNNKKCIIDVFK